MFTFAGIVTFLSTGAGSFILGAIGKFIQSWISDIRAEKAQKEIGRLQAERDQAHDALKKQAEMAAIAARRDTEDDVLKRLENGNG